MRKKTFKKRTTEEMIGFLQEKSAATAQRMEDDAGRIAKIEWKMAELSKKIELKAEQAKEKEEVRLKIQGYKEKIRELREGKKDVI